MWPWPAVPPLRAVELWPAQPLEYRATLYLDARVYPCYTHLAMGCSYAARLIMNINLTVVGRILLASSRVGDAAHELADLQSGGEEIPTTNGSQHRS